MKKIILIILKIYKNFFSPAFVALLGKGCRFTPTCGEYAQIAFERFGIWIGLKLTIKRIIKCNPYTKAGYDPLPINA